MTHELTCDSSFRNINRICHLVVRRVFGNVLTLSSSVCSFKSYDNWISLSVQRAHSLYTIPATDSNEFRSNPLVNLHSSHTSRTTRMEYNILDPSEEASPATPSISVSELATGPGSKVYWRIGIVVMTSLFLFVLLTIIILGVYFVKRYVVLSVELVLTF